MYDIVLIAAMGSVFLATSLAVIVSGFLTYDILKICSRKRDRHKEFFETEKQIPPLCNGRRIFALDMHHSSHRCHYILRRVKHGRLRRARYFFFGG